MKNRILVLAEHDGTKLNASTSHVIGCAIAIGAGEIDLLVAGDACISVAEQAASLAGVSRVLLAEHECYLYQSAEHVADLITQNSDGYTHVLAAATTFGKGVLPRVAAKLDVAQVSEITKVFDEKTFVRPIYAGNVLSTVSSQERVKVITVRASAFDPVSMDGRGAVIESISASVRRYPTRVMKREMNASLRPELTAATVVVSGGRGLGSAEEFRRLLEPLADKLNAAIGASRAAVDAGYVSDDCQVGQSGKVVAPRLYFAIGISGAIQHLAGMKDSKIIVAINNDPDAPIFQVADFGLVADASSAIHELVAAL